MFKTPYVLTALSLVAVGIGLAAALWSADDWVKWTFGSGLIGVCCCSPFAALQWWHSQ